MNQIPQQGPVDMAVLYVMPVLRQVDPQLPNPTNARAQEILLGQAVLFLAGAMNATHVQKGVVLLDSPNVLEAQHLKDFAQKIIKFLTDGSLTNPFMCTATPGSPHPNSPHHANLMAFANLLDTDAQVQQAVLNGLT